MTAGDGRHRPRRTRAFVLSHLVSLLLVNQGPVLPEPALAHSRVRCRCRQVFTRSTPPRWEGCRPASRGCVLELMTCRHHMRRERLVSNASRARCDPFDCHFLRSCDRLLREPGVRIQDARRVEGCLQSSLQIQAGPADSASDPGRLVIPTPCSPLIVPPSLDGRANQFVGGVMQRRRRAAVSTDALATLRTADAGCRHRHARPRRRPGHAGGRSPRSPPASAPAPTVGRRRPRRPASDRTSRPVRPPQAEVPLGACVIEMLDVPTGSGQRAGDGVDLRIGAVPVGLGDQQCGTSPKQVGALGAVDARQRPRIQQFQHAGLCARGNDAGHTGGGCGDRGKERHRCSGPDRPRPNLRSPRPRHPACPPRRRTAR